MDCKDKASCLGNRLEIVIIDGQERIKLIAPHHKTEGARSVESSSPISFTFPLCILNTLLVWWIKTGWHLVREKKQQASSMVFVSGHLKTLSASAMVGWWDLFKSKHCPSTLKPGTITELRSIFIEAYTEKVPDDENKWHKAALVMGNSLATWKKYYARTLKKRRMQDSIDSFASDFLDDDDDEEDEGEKMKSEGMSSRSAPMQLPVTSTLRTSPPSLPVEGRSYSLPMELMGMSEIEGCELGCW